MGRQYPCCDDPTCSMCEGSGLAEGAEADAVWDALSSCPPVYDEVQPYCPKCKCRSYEASPFGVAYFIRCADCLHTWVEPQ